MNPAACKQAAALLWRHFNDGSRFDSLPAECRPADRTEGYAVQAEWARLSGEPVVGWKIAATAKAGQQHIGVDGPLAGRLLRKRVLEPNAVIDLSANAMRVAEADARFYLRWRTDIAPATTQLRCDGQDYDVLAVDEIERRQWLEVIAQIVEV
jgi:2-keto-4-pentenoate hydratase